MFQYFSTILYVHFRNSREEKSASGVGNPCAPHPLNKSLGKGSSPAQSWEQVKEVRTWVILAKFNVVIYDTQCHMAGILSFSRTGGIIVGWAWPACFKLLDFQGESTMAFSEEA